MRRTDKEITEFSAIEEILNKEMVCRIGFSDNNKPYIVPMNYFYENNVFYMHCAKEGQKLENLRGNNKVCVEVDCAHELKYNSTACSFSFKYKSVIGFGKAEIIEDNDLKIEILNKMMNKFTGKTDWTIKEREVKKICIIKINLDSLTGKQSGY